MNQISDTFPKNNFFQERPLRAIYRVQEPPETHEMGRGTPGRSISQVGPKCKLNKCNAYIDLNRFILNIQMYYAALLGPTLKTNYFSMRQGIVNSGLGNKSIFNPQMSSNHKVEVFKQTMDGKLWVLHIKKCKDVDSITRGIWMQHPATPRQAVRMSGKFSSVLLLCNHWSSC